MNIKTFLLHFDCKSVHAWLCEEINNIYKDKYINKIL